jgi:hypothetical protein
VQEWSATVRTNASSSQVLEVLTRPGEIRRWSPVDFELDDLEARALAAGTRARVSGRLAGVTIGFDVEVHAADELRLELTAAGPVDLEVLYELRSDEAGAEVRAWVAMRGRRGLTGRVVANAAAALLSAGALERATGRIAEAAESRLPAEPPALAAAA